MSKLIETALNIRHLIIFPNDVSAARAGAKGDLVVKANQSLEVLYQTSKKEEVPCCQHGTQAHTPHSQFLLSRSIVPLLSTAASRQPISHFARQSEFRDRNTLCHNFTHCSQSIVFRLFSALS
jgi:hypothetical protein